MTSCMVIGFPTVSTHVTGAEKPRQTGNDIVMAFLVEQDQLFVLGAAKRRDVEGTVGVHQDDLVADEGRSSTKGRQGVVAARTQGNASFFMEQQREFFLEVASLSNGVPLRVLVHSGFGGDQGPGTTEVIVISDTDDRAFLSR